MKGERGFTGLHREGGKGGGGGEKGRTTGRGTRKHFIPSTYCLGKWENSSECRRGKKKKKEPSGAGSGKREGEERKEWDHEKPVASSLP